ncbi:MAG: radical SAM protein [Acidimicrobiia bacterium]|nr:radical SAM protein [Acidimicrobiia bacterium]
MAGFGRTFEGIAPTTGVPVSIGPTATGRVPDFDLLNLPRPRATAPWAYVKIAEGCDRACGFCAIPTFRGKQRSRSVDDIVAEVDAARRPRGRPRGPGPRRPSVATRDRASVESSS